MTCRVPAEEGTKVETQNVIGPRGTDLLQMADWFFPEGLDHHELMAGVPGVQRVMQAFARRVAGLGKLPERASAAQPAARRQVDALVVGAGPSGMAAATSLVRAGRQVEVLEEDLSWGGSLRALDGVGLRPWQPIVSSFREALASRTVIVRTRTVAAGVYGDDLLVMGAAGAEVLTWRTLVLAPGANDGVLPFEGNDCPGVLSARAAGRIASLGVSIGERVVVAVAPGGGPFGEALSRAHGGTLVRGIPVRAGGSGRVREVLIATEEGDRLLPCDALVLDAPRAPAYELCAQAGATLSHEPHGYVVRAPGGEIRPGVFVVGEAAGTPLEPGALLKEAAAPTR
jgi:sarcosine oxidase subunit alpha